MARHSSMTWHRRRRPTQDLLFEREFMAVRGEGQDALIDHETIQAILQGKKRGR